MFIFRWFYRILATLGIILAVLIVFFANFPLKVTATTDVYLSNIFNCEQSFIHEDILGVDESSLEEIKKQVGQNIPLDMAQSFSENLGKISATFGTKADVDVTYCSIPTGNNSMDKVKSYFSKNEAIYDYGSMDEFIRKINELPFVKLSITNFDVPTILSRTKTCVKPIHKSDFYFFMVDESVSKSVVLFKIKFIDDENATYLNKSLGNLVETGQYLKSKFQCND